MEETHTSTHIVCVLQASMLSRRLPGKAMLSLGDATVCEQVVHRIQAAAFGAQLVIVTTDDPADTPVAELCAARGWPWHAGHPDDWLNGTIEAAAMLDAEIVVRCTLSNLMLVPRMLDACARYTVESGMDYVCVRRLPAGVTVEAMPLRSLEQAAKHGTEEAYRRFVTSYICEHPEAFELAFLPAPPRIARPDLRFALETADDYRRMRTIYEHTPASAGGLIRIDDAILFCDSRNASAHGIVPLSESSQAA